MQGKRFEMFNLRSQQVKFNAFFQYLKSFSEAGLDTLQKLENEFNKEMRRKLKHSETLSTIKNLLSSYEIFILEIKDSCDFVEISEFGYCIGKTFLQLLKIIKWFLKSWLKDTRKFQKAKANLESQPIDEVNIPQQKLCPFCEQLIKTNPYGRQNKGKRKVVNINDTASEMRDANMSHKRQVDHMMDMKQNILERCTMKSIQSKKLIGDMSEIDILNRKHIAMKLQISNNQSVLEQVLNEFSVKTEAMSRFVSNTQASCIQDFRLNQESDYVQFQQQMKAAISEKYNQARDKIKNLVFLKIADHDKHRKDKLVHREVQTTGIEYSDKQKNEMRIKQLLAAAQKLKNQLQSQKALNESLKQLLQSKSIQFQKQFLNYRKEVISSDIKSKHYLKSLKSFKEALEQPSEEQDESNSIRLEQSTRQVPRIKKHMSKIASGNIRTKNRHSIKFAVEEGQNQDKIYQSLTKVRDSEGQKEAEVQTDPICFLDDPNSPQTLSNNYFIFNKEKPAAKSLLKEFRNTKIASQKIQIKKSQTQLYAHVKSKVLNIINNEVAKTTKRDFKQTTSSCMGEMVKKLSVECLFPRKRDPSLLPVSLYPLAQETIFTPIVSFYPLKGDIMDLFLSDRNARDYQCLIYRNSLFNLANLNQKRMINLSKQLQSSDLQWIVKKQSAVNESVEAKIVHAFYQQMTALRKKQRQVYQQIKQLMRSPYELSKKVEVIQLENSDTASKDIEVGELKKMLNIILKFHCDCIGSEKDCICEHIVNFSQKIGIKFI